jgi:hypothetical protein
MTMQESAEFFNVFRPYLNKLNISVRYGFRLTHPTYLYLRSCNQLQTITQHRFGREKLHSQYHLR